MAYQTGVDELFEGLPGLVKRNGVVLHFALSVEVPSGRIAFLGRDVCQGNRWEMDIGLVY